MKPTGHFRFRIQVVIAYYPSAQKNFVETSAGIVRQSVTVIIMQKKDIIRITLASAFILLLPLLVMQFTDEVVWDLDDFAVAGAFLFGADFTYELAARKAGNIAHRVALGLAVATALILADGVQLYGKVDRHLNATGHYELAKSILPGVVALLSKTSGRGE